MSNATESVPEATEAQDVVRTSRTVPAPVGKVWEHLISPTGTEALLGEGAALGSKGESWHSADGPFGVVRSFHPLQQLRVSWHADDDAPATLVDLQLAEQAGGTRIDLVHEHLVGTAGVRDRWEHALDRFASGLDA